MVVKFSRSSSNRAYCGHQFCWWSAHQEKCFFPCSRPRLRMWSRETSSAGFRPVSAGSFFTLRLNLMFTRVTGYLLSSLPLSATASLGTVLFRLPIPPIISKLDYFADSPVVSTRPNKTVVLRYTPTESVHFPEEANPFLFCKIVYARIFDCVVDTERQQKKGLAADKIHRYMLASIAEHPPPSSSVVSTLYYPIIMGGDPWI